MAEKNVKWTADDYKRAIDGMVEDQGMIDSNTNEERITHILREIRPRNEVRAEMEDSIKQFTIKTDKNIEKSEKYRFEGKELFDRKEYERALPFFSIAIMNAPHVQNPDVGDGLYQAYRHRSITYYELKDYEKSLFDINQALDICKRLEDHCHRINCLRYLRKYTDALDMITELLSKKFEFKLEIDLQLLRDLQALQPIIQNERQTTGDAQEIADENDCYLFVDDCVDFVESEEMGRYMISNSERPKDSVILREKAQYYLINENCLHEFCSNCRKRIGQRFFPCVLCTVCIFCDQNCYKEAKVGFHGYECGVTELVYGFSQYKHFALSILLSTGYTSARELVQYIDNCIKSGNRFDVKKWIEKYNNIMIPNGPKSDEHKREEFEAFLTFLDHSESQPLRTELSNCFEAIEMVSFIEIRKGFTIEDDQTFVSLAALLILLSRKVTYNSFSGYIGTETSGFTAVATAICLVSTMCNHSCVANINWKLMDEIQEFKTHRPIREGEEISDSYGPSSRQSLNERQQYLKDHYNFICGCVLCENEKTGNLSLRCLACDGPVFDSSVCLDCAVPYVRYEQSSNAVNHAIETFKTMAYNIHSNVERSESMEKALRIVEFLNRFVYPRNPDLISVLRISQSFHR